MEFLKLSDKLDDFRYAYTTKERLASGAAIFGTVLANTVIAAGKFTVALGKEVQAKNGQSHKP
ncbi:MAG: hypothetical protein EKK46_10905 [Rhodocyclaceae bacterium]|nr:MAG: hypothetical protein EKK46_10905 [Rhodocyclaceae bacterium]